ncbi:MAG: hypothetical protein Q4A60_06620 [Pasteurellaceae bacterium]|nr:hypothetical protein [Pasteurellaceae bacterium]
MKLKATLLIELDDNTLNHETLIFHPQQASNAYDIAFKLLAPFKERRACQESAELYQAVKAVFNNQKSDSPE